MTQRIGICAVMVVLVSAAWAAPAWPPDAGPDTTAETQPGDDMAQALVDGWIEALGGMETYWKLRSASYTLTTEMWDPDSGRLRRTRPRYVTIARLETERRPASSAGRATTSSSTASTVSPSGPS